MNVQATKCNFLRALVKWMVFIKVRLFFHHEVIKGSSLKKYTQNQSYVFCFLFFKLNIIFILFIIMDFKKCSKNLFKVDQTTPKPSSLWSLLLSEQMKCQSFLSSFFSPSIIRFHSNNHYLSISMFVTSTVSSFHRQPIPSSIYQWKTTKCLSTNRSIYRRQIRFKASPVTGIGVCHRVIIKSEHQYGRSCDCGSRNFSNSMTASKQHWSNTKRSLDRCLDSCTSNWAPCIWW